MTDSLAEEKKNEKGLETEKEGQFLQDFAELKQAASDWAIQLHFTRGPDTLVTLLEDMEKRDLSKSMAKYRVFQDTLASIAEHTERAAQEDKRKHEKEVAKFRTKFSSQDLLLPLTVKQLKEVLSDCGLDTSGNKAVLFKRLVEFGWPGSSDSQGRKRKSIAS